MSYLYTLHTPNHSHFADVIVANDPDVVALQEVRLDSSFVSPSSQTRHWHPHNNNGKEGPGFESMSRHKEDAGNQAEHVLSHLAQARTRAAAASASGADGTKNSSSASNNGREQHYYQFVFQPAMSMIDR